MKTLATLLIVSLLGIMVSGCSMMTSSQYKPLYQVKPEKKMISSGK